MTHPYIKPWELWVFALLLAICWLMASMAVAAPGQVRLTWDRPQTCADGSPIPDTAPLLYNIYQANQPDGYDFDRPWLQEVPSTTVVVSAPGRKYWVATTLCLGAGCTCTGESAPSNELETHQVGNPQRLR